MAKSRLLSSSLGKSRKFREVHGKAKHLGEFCQLLYCLLIPCADDFGRQDGDGFSVKMHVFPSCTRSETEFDQALSYLADVGLIILYGDNHQFLQIVNFEEFQSGLHKRTSSKFPEPPEIPGNSGNFREIPSDTESDTEHEQNRNRTELEGGISAEQAQPPKKPKRQKDRTPPPDRIEITSEMRAWALSVSPGVDVDREVENCLDYHRGKGNLMADWTATIRTWIRNSKRFGGSNGNGAPPRIVGGAAPKPGKYARYSEN